MASLDISATTVPGTRTSSRRWGFLGSTLWALAATAALFAAQLVAFTAVLIWSGDAGDPALQAPLLRDDAVTISAATIAACPAVLGVLWLAARLARRRFTGYLALRWPSRADLYIGVAVSLLFLPLWDTVSGLTGHVLSPDFVLDITRSARDAGLQWLLLVALCVAAPITEEFAVRGFLYRGYAASFLGPLGAILLSSAMWTAIHVQYDAYFMTEVLLIGLLLGYMRYRSGSTWLTVIMHGLFNLSAFAQAAWIVART
jgi:membrane protease YdiL (CAAX protease family)